MTKEFNKKLLDIPEVIDEINRHLWLESEKAGHDIGFEAAARDWMNNYASDWVNYYMPSKKEIKPKEARITKSSSSSSKRTRGRSAKNYS